MRARSCEDAARDFRHVRRVVVKVGTKTVSKSNGDANATWARSFAAQVRGLRGEIDGIERAKKRVEYDTYYIDHWSPLLDMRIILETLFIIVWDRNAY